MSPLRWGRAFLELLVPRGQREEVLGDLEEVHRKRVERRGAARAGLATCAEALGLAATFGGQRVRHGLSRALVSTSELRLALRFLARTPVLFVTVVLALTLGIGLATTTFTVLSAVLHPELPFPGGDRFVEGVVRATLVARFPPPPPWIFPALCAGVLATALLAALAPLRRVLAVTPARSLQAE